MDNKGKTESGNPEIAIIEEKISKVNGDIAIKRYQKGKMLGKGGFAKCYEVTNLDTKKIYAAKIIPKSSLTKSRSKQKLISEIKIHKALQNQNVVKFEHVFEDHEYVYILLELCTNQTLNELIKRRKRLTELEVQCYIVQILTALRYLIKNRVIHRDLKLGNLFLSDKMEIKLGDFGLAAKLEFDEQYVELLIIQHLKFQMEKLDILMKLIYGLWVYTLLIGKPPYETPDVKTTYKKIKMNNYSFPDHVPISDGARNLITKILNLTPSKRPTIDEIFHHQFLNNGGTIPKLLPLSTLACPPSASYQKLFQIFQLILLRQYQNDDNAVRVGQQSNRLIESQNFNEKTNQQSNFATQSNFNKDNVQIGYGNRPTTTTQTSGFKGGQSMKNVPQSQQNNQQFGYQTTTSLSNKLKSQQQPGKSEVWVRKWVDYSSKYGLGYLLSNGSTGVFFNDSTKIILHPKATYFEYMERKQNDKQDIISQHTFSDYPKELKKKVTLLQHFKNYLEGDKFEPIQSASDPMNKSQPLIYLKKWMKTRHAIMFRLSNKIVQVNFTDKTEIILSSESKMLTYVNKKGERQNYPLATALDSDNAEMTKRLKYTKEILAHMLNNQQTHQDQRLIIFYLEYLFYLGPIEV